MLLSPLTKAISHCLNSDQAIRVRVQHVKEVLEENKLRRILGTKPNAKLPRVKRIFKNLHPPPPKKNMVGHIDAIGTVYYFRIFSEFTEHRT